MKGPLRYYPSNIQNDLSKQAESDYGEDFDQLDDESKTKVINEVEDNRKQLIEEAAELGLTQVESRDMSNKELEEWCQQEEKEQPQKQEPQDQPSSEPSKNGSGEDDYNKLLTNDVKKIINDSIHAAKFDNVKPVIDTDKIISLFTDKLSPDEYEKFDWDKAEDFLLDYLKKSQK
jgi:hypothetical protein